MQLYYNGYIYGITMINEDIKITTSIGLLKDLESTPRLYVKDPIQNNLKYNIPNIQGKYNRMVIPSVKWEHPNNHSIIKPSMKYHTNNVLDISNINGNF
ncbi:hypothetical protein H8356DRAFT_1361687 [Neocallimastix lanati (nom. inval.)]|nr:hypothetical protein H8356DRAFT_1361687 [Neocallimastix sp. JGI-2020a]